MLTAQDEVIKNLGIIFGIALSAEDDPPVRIMACHALCACKKRTPAVFLANNLIPPFFFFSLRRKNGISCDKVCGSFIFSELCNIA